MLIKTILLGIIQGLTEFLPISSSGHLVIMQKLLGFEHNQLTISIFLHFGTLIPVAIIFWSDIKDILLFKKEKRHLTWLILVGIIPTGLMGIYLEDFFTKLYSSVIITGFMLIITGFLLYFAEKYSTARKKISDFKYFNALLVGVFQGMAIIPGISRSGSTIVASLIQNLKREEAARFSFLLSLPVIFGASLLEFIDVYKMGLNEINWIPVIAGVISAAIAGYFAIKFLLRVLKTGSLVMFSYYCWIIGFVVIFTAGLS